MCNGLDMSRQKPPGNGIGKAPDKMCHALGIFLGVGNQSPQRTGWNLKKEPISHLIMLYFSVILIYFVCSNRMAGCRIRLGTDKLEVFLEGNVFFSLVNSADVTLTFKRRMFFGVLKGCSTRICLKVN